MRDLPAESPLCRPGISGCEQEIRHRHGQDRAGFQAGERHLAVRQLESRRQRRWVVGTHFRLRGSEHAALQGGDFDQLRVGREIHVPGRRCAHQCRHVLLRLQGLPGIFPQCCHASCRKRQRQGQRRRTRVRHRSCARPEFAVGCLTPGDLGRQCTDTRRCVHYCGDAAGASLESQRSRALRMGYGGWCRLGVGRQQMELGSVSGVDQCRGRSRALVCAFQRPGRLQHRRWQMGCVGLCSQSDQQAISRLQPGPVRVHRFQSRGVWNAAHVRCWRTLQLGPVAAADFHDARSDRRSGGRHGFASVAAHRGHSRQLYWRRSVHHSARIRSRPGAIARFRRAKGWLRSVDRGVGHHGHYAADDLFLASVQLAQRDPGVVARHGRNQSGQRIRGRPNRVSGAPFSMWRGCRKSHLAGFHGGGPYRQARP